MNAGELKTVKDAVRDALETVRCLETEARKGMATKKDIKAFLGGDLEGVVVAAFRILEDGGPDTS